MGLTMDTVTPYGNTVSLYYRIHHVGIDWESEKAQVRIRSYISRDEAIGGAGSLEEDMQTLRGTDVSTWFAESILEAGGTNIRKQAYEFIKTRNKYSTAVDVLET